MELVDIVDENNELTGQVEERWTAYNNGLWRRTVSCWLINEKGEILLQKRTANKLRNPNKWSKTGGQVDCGHRQNGFNQVINGGIDIQMVVIPQMILK